MSPSKLKNVLLIFAVLSISCLVITSSGQETDKTTDAPTTIPATTDNSTTSTSSTSTTSTTTTTTTTTTVKPDNSTTTTTVAPTPTPDHNTTTTTPAPTPDNHNVTTTTVAPTPTPDNNNKTTTIAPTPEPTTPAPPAPHCNCFDGYSFIGGVILATGSMAIGLVLYKFYKAREVHSQNYHTL